MRLHAQPLYHPSPRARYNCAETQSQPSAAADALARWRQSTVDRRRRGDDRPRVGSDLEGASLQVVGPAHSVDHARKLLAHQHVDAALLDVNLAGERTDDLAATQAHDKVPFAFLTGYGREALPVAFASAPLVPSRSWPSTCSAP
jgi:hypothetical protein